MHFGKKLLSTLALAALLIGGATVAQAQAKKDFKVAWSIYVGWMPWGWASDTGIVKKFLNMFRKTRFGGGIRRGWMRYAIDRDDS